MKPWLMQSMTGWIQQTATHLLVETAFAAIVGQPKAMYFALDVHPTGLVRYMRESGIMVTVG